MDVLTDVLSALDLDSELYFRATFRGPFAIRVPAEASRIRFHVVSHGRCWIALEDGTALVLGAGDLVLVPHGATHVLADAQGREAQPLDEMIDAADRLSASEIAYGSGSPSARLVCGHFSYRANSLHPLFRSLPALLHVRAGQGGRYDWVEALLRHLDDEARCGRAGAAQIVRRLSEILLIEVLRAQVEAGPSSGALRALADPTVRRALEEIHAGPGTPWSLGSLAARAGVSRTVLSDRFRETLGTSPMRYLAQWRMERARHLLERPDLNVGEIAGLVGYASEAAFNRAFKAIHGEPPGRLRASLQHGRPRVAS